MATNTRPQDFLLPGTSGWMELQTILSQVDALTAKREQEPSLAPMEKRLSRIRQRAENITRDPQHYVETGRITQALRVLFAEETPSPDGKGDRKTALGRLIRALLIVLGVKWKPVAPIAQDGATWADLYEIQHIRLELLEGPRLKLELAELRTNFKLFAGPVLHEHYRQVLAELPPKDNGSAEELVRAEALFLLEQTQHIQSYRPHQERRRLSISYDILRVTLVLVSVVWVVSFALERLRVLPEFPIGLFLILSLGALGASFSTLQRIQRSFKEGRMIINSTRYMRKFKDWLSPPITGAVFAFIASLLFYAGFVGNLVPSDSLDGSNKTISGTGFLRELMGAAVPQPDFIRILNLSFAAGFAERLVPDTLDRLTGGRTPKKDDSTAR